MGPHGYILKKKEKKRIVDQNLHHNFTYCHRCNRTEI